MSSVRRILSSTVKTNKIIVNGWVRALRKQKKYTFIDVDDGSSSRYLQVIHSTPTLPQRITVGSSIRAIGTKNVRDNQVVEVHSEELHVLCSCDPKLGYPVNDSQINPIEGLRKSIHLRPKSKYFGSICRLRHFTCQAIHKYFSQNECIEIHAPILTSNDCEGAGETFWVKGKENETTDDLFFGAPTYLTVSGQLHLEAAASGLSRVYTLGPAFRAEQCLSTRHLAEFYMLEAEIAFLMDLEQLMKFVENLVKYIGTSILDGLQEDLSQIWELQPDKIDLQSIFNHEYQRISYDDALKALKVSNSQKHLSRDQELQLVKMMGNRPVFVTNFPVEAKPFYMKSNEANNEAICFDLLVPRIGELCGGSLREDRYDVLANRLKHLRLYESLYWYLDLRRFGSVPTGGFGLGLERLLMMFTGLTNIRDTIPFPRYFNHCKM